MSKAWRVGSAVACLGLLVLLVRCGVSKSTLTASTSKEFSAQLGDLAAAIDDMATGTSGAFAMLESARRRTSILEPQRSLWAFLERLAISQASATNCSALTLADCASNTRTLTLADCSVGTSTFTGTIKLTFNDAAVDNTCQMTAAGHSVARDPEYTMAGVFGNYTVTLQGTTGEVITKQAAADTYSFASGGVERSLKKTDGTTVFDFTTSASGVTVTGATRAARVATGGTFTVVNNVSAAVCNLAVSNLTWASTCNCPVSGSLSGACTTGTASVIFTGCGTVSTTLSGVTTTETLDRCYAI